MIWLHPPTVHIPVGLLLVGSLLELWTQRRPQPAWAQAARVMLLFGWWGCVLALATGLLTLALDWSHLEGVLGLLNAHAALALLLTAVYWRLVLGRPSLSPAQRRPWLLAGVALIGGVGWLGGELLRIGAQR